MISAKTMQARPHAIAYHAPATPSFTAYCVVPITTPEPMLAPTADAIINQMPDCPDAVRKSFVVLACLRPRSPMITLIAIKTIKVTIINVYKLISM